MSTVPNENRKKDPRQTLADFGLPENLHIAGRLDRESEGLLLLMDDGQFTARVLSEACQKE
jgi:16S rRNA U516 pseudouridylate synthase RsuA-like enzyme